MSVNKPSSPARDDDAVTPESGSRPPVKAPIAPPPPPPPSKAPDDDATPRSTDPATSDRATPDRTTTDRATPDRTTPDRTSSDGATPDRTDSVPSPPAARPAAHTAHTAAPADGAATAGDSAVDDDPGGLNRRMEHAVGSFVDDPRGSVREADAVLDETVRRLTRMLEERRTKLRDSWHDGDGDALGTEELRVALTRYRDMARQLMDVS